MANPIPIIAKSANNNSNNHFSRTYQLIAQREAVGVFTVFTVFTVRAVIIVSKLTVLLIHSPPDNTILISAGARESPGGAGRRGVGVVPSMLCERYLSKVSPHRPSSATPQTGKRLCCGGAVTTAVSKQDARTREPEILVSTECDTVFLLACKRLTCLTNPM